MSFSPTLGRFLERDPMEYKDGPNLYQYCRSNPASLTDPMGTYPKGFQGPRPIHNDPGDDGRTQEQYKAGLDHRNRRRPQGAELENLKTAVCLLKNNTKYAKFGDLMEQMLADGKILVADLGFKSGGAAFGQTRVWTNDGAIEIDKDFAAIADCKNRSGLATLAETLVHEWSHLTTYEGNPTGLNTIGKIVGGGILRIIPWWWDDDGSFRTVGEYGPHNLGADVRNQILNDLKNCSPCCGSPTTKPSTTQPAGG